MIENIIIRNERKEDYRKVENLTREAFWNVYRPGCTEHYVLRCYRGDPAFVPELDFVMELNGELIGQIIYVRSEDPKSARKLPNLYRRLCRHFPREGKQMTSVVGCADTFPKGESR